MLVDTFCGIRLQFSGIIKKVKVFPPYSCQVFPPLPMSIECIYTFHFFNQTLIFFTSELRRRCFFPKLNLWSGRHQEIVLFIKGGVLAVFVDAMWQAVDLLGGHSGPWGLMKGLLLLSCNKLKWAEWEICWVPEEPTVIQFGKFSWFSEQSWLHDWSFNVCVIHITAIYIGYVSSEGCLLTLKKMPWL